MQQLIKNLEKKQRMSFWKDIAEPQQKRMFADVHKSEAIIKKANKRTKVPYKPIASEQIQMYYNNRYPKGTSFEQAVTGVLDKLTKQALINENIATTNYKTGNKIVDRLNTLYPYGYTNKLNQGIWGAITKLFSNENPHIQEYADLDLTRTPKEIADSIYKLAIGDSDFGLSKSTNELKQFSLRARIDANRLFGGVPQRYNTWSQDNGYTTKEGKRTWTFDDKDKIKAENKFLKKKLQSGLKNVSKNSQYEIYQLQEDPFVIYNKYSIIKDKKSESPKTIDKWDFTELSSYLPGVKEILLGHEIK